MASPPRLLVPTLAVAATAAALVAGSAVDPGSGTAVAAEGAAGTEGRAAAKRRTLDENPCISRRTARRLRCPDLEMSRPSNMFLSRSRSGKLRLHAANSINSVGSGPAELRGRRTGRLTMRAKQAIHRVGGGKLYLETGARLGFKRIPGQYRYWKFIHAAKFELWRLNKRGRRVRLAREGPKVSYCLRDLQRRFGSLPGSPSRFHYPGCSQRRDAQRVTLGTSVGWSDVYPSTYHEQWVNVTGLRGCFAYVHIADPRNGIYESNEDNNEAEAVVRLPWRGPARRGCPGRSRGPAGPDGGTEAPSY